MEPENNAARHYLGKDFRDSGKVTFTNEINVAYLSQVPVLKPDFTVMQ
jgi:hypothetical protein